MSITEYFPYSTPRPGQIEATEHILKAIDEGYEYICLDASTGFGKSAIARTLTDYYARDKKGTSYILTSTKLLQDQYLLDTLKNNKFNVNYKVGKGRNNFTCNYLKNRNEIEVTCDNGECQTTLEPEHFKCGYRINSKEETPVRSGTGCSYWDSKLACIDSEVALLNYSLKITDTLYGIKDYKPRNFAVLDEAHNIESQLMDSISINLYEPFLKKDINYTFNDIQLSDQWDINDWIIEIGYIMDKYKDKLATYTGKIWKAAQEKKRIEKRYNQIRAKYDKLKNSDNEWVISITVNKTRTGKVVSRSIDFKPVFIRDYIKNLLLNSADVILFMSGSFISTDQFCYDLGLEQDEVFVEKAKSIFNFRKQNPIIIDFAGSMSYNKRESTFPKTFPKLRKIFNKHKKDKGIIHAHSSEFAKKIIQEFKDTKYENRLITYDSTKPDKVKGGKDERLEYFKQSNEPLIMVSYSMQEGVDLKYDECRFQILFKAPFLDLSDNQVATRNSIDPSWYMVRTMQIFQQTYGRGMRAEDDYCVNYLLDSSFYRLIKSPYFPWEMEEALIK